MEISKVIVQEMFNKEMDSIESQKSILKAKAFNDMIHETIQNGQTAKYLKERIYKLHDGRIATFCNGEMKVFRDDDEFDNHFGKFLKIFYVKDPKLSRALANVVTVLNTDEYTIIYDVHTDKYTVDTNKKILYLPFAQKCAWELDEVEIPNCAEDVATVENFLLNVLCRGKSDQFEYLLDWISLAVKKQLTQKLLVLYTRSGGCGKGTFVDILKSILGDLMTVVHPKVASGDDMFNFQLVGRSLIYLEELPEHDFLSKDKILKWMKDNSTAKNTIYRNMREKGIEMEHFANYMLTTNFTIDLKDRRAFVLDIDTSFAQKEEYWKDLRNSMKNINTFKMLHRKLMLRKITIETFLGKPMPETETKQEYILSTLRTPIQFLKNVYVLPKVNDKMPRKEFYDKYVSWCKSENLNSKMICQNHSFYKEVEENGVEKYRTRYNGESGVHCFKVDFEALTKLFTTKKYLVESDYAEFNLEQKSKVSSFCDSDTDDDDEEDIQRQIIVLQRKLQAIKDKKKPVTVSQITWDDILADDKQQPKPQQPKEIKSRHITKTLSNANDVTFEEW